MRPPGGKAGSGGTALHGLRIAVTRPASVDDRLAALLAERGAEPVVVPLVRIEAASDPAPLLEAARAIDDYDWIVFTSANGVTAFRAALETAAGAGGPPPRGRVAVVGPATAEAVRHMLGWAVSAMPDRFTGEAVAAAMEALSPLRGCRVLWPKAAQAREALGRDLAAAGARLDAPEAYVTLEDTGAARYLGGLLRAGALHAVTLTSPSAARCLGAVQPPLEGVVVAVIGPSTAGAARAAALPVHVEPGEHTLSGLVDALAYHFAQS
jgi:uroporphyrinogen-III synthase